MTGGKNIPAEKLWIAYLVFIAGIVLTITGSYFIHQTIQAREREEFHAAATETEAKILTRIEAYIALLRGGGGLYAVNNWVEPEEFRLFFERLRIKEFYPGVQGLGYAMRVTPTNQQDILNRIRRTDPKFQIMPALTEQEAYPIILLEPQDKRNRAAMGFDMFSEPVRRAAMARARDQGLPAATGRVTLVQEIDQKKQSGFLIYLPVYASGGLPKTVEERRNLVEGFIYAPFRAEDFLKHIGSGPTAWKLRFQVFDGPEIGSDHLMFDSALIDPRSGNKAPTLRRTATITIAGRPWTLQFYGPGASSFLTRFFPVFPAGGLILAFVLFYLTQAEARARHRSEEALKRLQHSQAALEASEELHRTVTQTASDGIILVDENDMIQSVNAAVEHIFGYKAAELLNQPLVIIVPERLREAHINGFQRFAQTRVRAVDWRSLQLPGLRKDGTEVPLEISYGSFTRDGKLFVTGILRDISVRLKAEAMAHASQQQLQTMADALPVLIGAVDRDLRYRFNNKTYETWFGRSSESLKGQHMREVIGESAFTEIAPHVAKGLTGVEVSFEASMSYLSNMPSRHVHGTIIPERHHDGTVIGLFLLILDISDRKRQEDAARFIADVGKKFAETLTYEPTLRTIAEHAVPRIADWCAVDLLAQDGTVQRVQSSHADQAKQATADAISSLQSTRPHKYARKVMERGEALFLPDVSDAVLKEIAPDDDRLQLLRSAGIKSMISAPIRGRRRIYGTISLATVRSGRVYTSLDLNVAEELASRAGLAIENALLYQEAQQEIEERRIIEQALRESEERFRIMVEQARDYAIFMLNPEGRISSWNSGAERILGYEESEILGSRYSILFTPEEMADGADTEELDHARATGQALEERWHLRKDGSRFFCSSYLFALRAPNGELRGFTKIMRDITERKRWEEDIQKLNAELETRVEQRTAALRDSYEQMETFTYTVAHDLRAPLRSMLGFSEAILEESGDCLDDTSKDFLNRIIRASYRMDSLIQDLLAYSHITRMDLKFEAIDVQKVIEDARQLITDDLQKKDVTFVVHAPFPPVYGHRATLHTIVFNLLSNAVKFSSRNMSPRVELRAETRTYDSHKFVRIWVIDNGIGIAPEHHERIFRVFERLHSNESYTGTGIGLAIVKKGVERMGGHVGVESKLNEGSRFWIELPAA